MLPKCANGSAFNRCTRSSTELKGISRIQILRCAKRLKVIGRLMALNVKQPPITVSRRLRESEQRKGG